MAQQLSSAMGQARLAARVRGMLGVEEDPNLKVGLNGFGRRGRLLCRAIREASGIDLVAINDPYIDVDYMAHMLQHDRVRGPYRGSVVADSGGLLLDGKPVTVTAHVDPGDINWFKAGARYVVECSGAFETQRTASAHLRGGAVRVVVAAPCRDAPTYVMGVNHLRYADEPCVSAGSAPTHCLALLAKAVDDAFGIDVACANVLLAQQPAQLEQVTPGPSGVGCDGWRSGRGGGVDIVPSASDAVDATRLLLPELADRLHGAAYRVPAPGGVSLIDLTVSLRQPAELREIMRAMRAAADSPALRGRLGYREDAVRSGADFASDGRSAVFDGHTSVALSPTFAKLAAWFDNEWPHARRVVELLLHIQAVEHGVPHEALV